MEGLVSEFEIQEHFYASSLDEQGLESIIWRIHLKEPGQLFSLSCLLQSKAAGGSLASRHQTNNYPALICFKAANGSTEW